jgi:hypothetical protein
MAVAASSFATPYVITGNDVLLCHNESDLARLIQLNKQHDRQGVRALYQQLLANDTAASSKSLQGYHIDVTAVYTDGVARFEFQGETVYIAREDIAPESQAAQNTSSAVNISQGDYFVFVPLPCPTDYVYDGTEEFMDTVIKKIDSKHYKVVIVRACYNDLSNLAKQQDPQNDWWGDETGELLTRYAAWMKEGTVTVVDSMPDLPNWADLKFTPVGYFFHNGRLLWTANPSSKDADTVIGSLYKSY